jgi:hypothetical protein
MLFIAKALLILARDREFGAWGIRCGTVAQPFTPIEVPAQGERKIKVYWQPSTDDWDNPKYFVVLRSREKRTLNGRYRLIIRDALEPRTVYRHPSAVYSATSKEFIIASEANPALAD